MSETGAIVTVGSELVEGLRVDTNTAEIARALAGAGVPVVEAVSVGDDVDTLADALARLCSRHAVVVVTGGLGPTHDDITRQAAARALSVPLVRDDRLVSLLRPAMARHTDPEAAEQVLVQAMVLHGADVIDPMTGTAPGQVVPTPAGRLVLLPGPPSEMRPMLERVIGESRGARAQPRELGIAQMTESDVQVRVQRAIEGIDGVGFTVLARPGDVRAILTDQGGGRAAVDRAASRATSALGDACYSSEGRSLAETLVGAAAARGVLIALAESCTGGMVASAVTDVAGSSAVFLGGVVSYSDSAKAGLLGVSTATLDAHGAVSEETVAEMAMGARSAFRADLALAISGIAGPGGGTGDKPVGTVWFAVSASPGDPVTVLRRFTGDRHGVRLRATSLGLDLLRRAVLGMPLEPTLP